MRRLSIVVLILAVLVAACSGGDEDVAGVGDAVIRLSDIQAMYDTKVPVDDGFRETLFAAVAVEALKQSLTADYGVTLDPAAVDEYYAQLEATITQAAATPADLLGVENASMEMVRLNAEVLALRDAALAVLVYDPSVVDGLFANPDTMTTVCVQHILVDTLEEAEAAKARIEAGEDFATVADEVSLDTYSTGGDLGCTSSDDYVPEFAQATLEAPIGELYGPIETDYGFHLLIVSQRTTHTREEYLADPMALLSDQQANTIWVDWLDRVLEASDAWVAAAYGTWTPSGIEAPTGDTTTTTATTTSGG